MTLLVLNNWAQIFIVHITAKIFFLMDGAAHMFVKKYNHIHTKRLVVTNHLFFFLLMVH